jgi:hypothetical protein
VGQPIQAEELIPKATINRFERLAVLLEEVCIITEELKDEDNIELNFKIDLG